MPNGRTLQVATYHHYKDQWASAFNLSYEDSDGTTKPCHQTTFGMSERLLGAVVGMHGDDNGLVMPPAVAPIQIVIMPIAQHVDQNVITTVHALSKELDSFGFRVHVDDRDMRPGAKHYDWEIKGVPLRVEIGPRDLESSSCLVSIRTGGKEQFPIDGFSNSAQKLLDSVSSKLRSNAQTVADGMVHPFPGLADADAGILATKHPIEDGCVYELAFDGSDSDAEILEKSTGLTLLGESDTPFDEPVPCAVTGKPTTRRQHIARMY